MTKINKTAQAESALVSKRCGIPVPQTFRHAAEWWEPGTILTDTDDAKDRRRSHSARLLKELSEQVSKALGVEEAAELWQQYRPRNRTQKGPHDPAADSEALKIFDTASTEGKTVHHAVNEASEFLTARREYTKDASNRKHISRLVKVRNDRAMQRRGQEQFMKTFCPPPILGNDVETLAELSLEAISPARFGESLRLFGKATKYSPNHMAAELGVSLGTLNNYFQGKTQPMKWGGNVTPKELGEAFVMFYKALDLVPKQMAFGLKVSPGTLSNWLNGRTEPKTVTPGQIKFFVEHVRPRIDCFMKAGEIFRRWAGDAT